jgi:hypothetical protein
MTPSEFKAWFDGFTEAFGGRVPTKAQWARVKDRVAEIDGKPVTERVYIDRYYQHYWQQPYYYNPNYQTGWLAMSSSNNSLGTGTSNLAGINQAALGGYGFNSGAAMAALGRAEAASLGGAQ